jgi:hypothetical protein
MPQIQIRADAEVVPHSFLMACCSDGSEDGFGLISLHVNVPVTSSPTRRRCYSLFGE